MSLNLVGLNLCCKCCHTANSDAIIRGGVFTKRSEKRAERRRTDADSHSKRCWWSEDTSPRVEKAQMNRWLSCNVRLCGCTRAGGEGAESNWGWYLFFSLVPPSVNGDSPKHSSRKNHSRGQKELKKKNHVTLFMWAWFSVKRDKQNIAALTYYCFKVSQF